MLLHGRGRNHLSVVNDSVLKLEIVKRKYIIVFPNGEDGWYIDSPTIPESRYHSMLVELLRTIRGNFPVSNSPDKSGICGWSMGGYGAMYFAAQSDQVSIVASTIGLLDYPNPELPAEDNYRNGKDVPAVFGDDPTQWLQLNCTQQADKIRRKKILIIGGNSGMDLRMNMNSHQKLVELNIEHTYIHFNGGHSWTTVQKTIPMMLDFMDMHFIVKNSH
jgi:S-formylglutathione hydrolase FrmB